MFGDVLGVLGDVWCVWEWFGVVGNGLVSLVQTKPQRSQGKCLGSRGKCRLRFGRFRGGPFLRRNDDLVTASAWEVVVSTVWSW